MERVLVVDDDRNLLDGIRRGMGRSFEIDVALGAAEALARLRAGERYAAIVSDMHMPGADGLEFLEQARALAPLTPRIMLTGRADPSVLLGSINRAAVTRFLEKPVAPSDLAACLHACIAAVATGPAAPPEDEAAARRSAWIRQGLAGADHDRELKLLFQPRVAVGDGRIEGVEALLRWTHPVHGPVSPQEFIPVAEAGRLIDQLTTWVLDTACRRWRAWREGGLDISVSVNVSPASLGRPSLAASVVEALSRADMPPSRLELEVTEGSGLLDTEDTRAALAALRRLGVRIAIDDFGVGFASMSAVRMLEVDVIKIDRSFVAQAPDRPRDRAILRAMRELTRDLGMTVVAEGVEDMRHEALIRCIGMDQMQGFLYARPLCAEDLGGWAAARPAGWTAATCRPERARAGGAEARVG